MMKIDFPFETTSYLKLDQGKSTRINPEDHMTYIYLGSMVNQDVLTTLEWSKYVEPKKEAPKFATFLGSPSFMLLAGLFLVFSSSLV